MKKSWLICGAILAALALAAPTARAAVVATLSLDLLPDWGDNYFGVYLSLSDPDDETLGLHGIYFNVWGTGGLTVDSAGDTLPLGSSAGPQGPGAMGFGQQAAGGTPITGGFELIGSMQANIHKVGTLPARGTNIYQGVGETPGSAWGDVEWDAPVLIGYGVYSGEGTVHVSALVTGTTLLPAVLPAATTAGAEFQAFLPSSVVGATLQIGSGYNVLQGQPYALFSPAPIPSDALDGLGTTGQLIGPFTASQDTDVSMDWRVALGDEADLLISDVVDLNGIVAGDTFVLQMSYNPAVLVDRGILDEESFALQGGIYVARNIGTPGAPVWVNAGDADKFFLGPYDDHGLGSWGVDTGANVAWVVTNQSSEFAVVPEPGTIMLLLLGGLGLALCRRRIG